MATRRSTSTKPQADTWVNRIGSEIRLVDPSELVANPLNARTHPAAQRAALRTVLGEIGWVAPVTVNATTGRMIDGHARVEEAVARGVAEVPVIFVELTDQEERDVLATLDPIGAMATYDTDVLAELLAGVSLSSPDLDAMLAELVAAPDPATPAAAADAPDVDEVPDAPLEPVTKPGDVWLLGPHRIICGSCRDADDVERLLAGVSINLAFTSPPYAEQREYDESSGFKPIPPDEYVDWFEPVSGNVAANMADDGSWFVNIKPSVSADGLDTETYVLDLVLAHRRRWGWHWATEFCWERNGVPKSVTRRFKNQFEPVYQFVLGPWKMRADAVRHESEYAVTATGPGVGNTSWADPNSNTVSQGQKGDLFDDRRGTGLAYPGNRLPTFAGSHEALGHGAAFPVGLPQWFVKAYTDPGDTVFDPFMGSGSTLMAAHFENRTAYGTELSPMYVDIICRRFQRHTGIVPVLESTGEPHDFTGAG